MVAGFSGWVEIPRERARGGKPVQAYALHLDAQQGGGAGRRHVELGMQLLVEILSHRLEALGSIPSTDEPGLGGHVCNSSTRGCRQENPKFQLYSEFYATLGYKMLSQKKRGRQS